MKKFNPFGHKVNSMAQEEEKQEGGADADSRKAGIRLAAAVQSGDVQEIQEAVHDQSAALINMSMTTVIPTLKTVLETVLRTEIGNITQRLDNRDRYDLDRRTEESTRRQAQEVHLYDELDKLGEGQGHIMAALEATATEIKKDIGDMGETLLATVGRVSNLEEVSQDHGQQIAAHTARIEVGEARTTALEIRMTTIEAEHRSLRSQVGAILTHLKRDKEFLRQLREEHGE